MHFEQFCFQHSFVFGHTVAPESKYKCIFSETFIQIKIKSSKINININGIKLTLNILNKTQIHGMNLEYIDSLCSNAPYLYYNLPLDKFSITLNI